MRRPLPRCCDCAVSSAWGLACSDSEGNGATRSKEVQAVAKKLTAAQRRRLSKEAEEWDQLSDEDFARLIDEGTPVQVRFRRPPPKTLTVALDEQTLNRLRRIARRKQVRPRQLAAIWIAERLREEPATEPARRTG